MKSIKFIIQVFLDLILFLLLSFPLFSEGLNVVSTSTDLANIAKEIGGGLVDVKSLAKGNENLHYIPARPDYIIKTNRADVFLLIGADIEIGWVPLILKNSRNSNVQPGRAGYCDVSRGIILLDKKKGKIDRQMGDVHPSGNPHYWNDPINGIKMAKYIKQCFSKVDPQNKNIYHKNFLSFQSRLKTLTKKLLVKIKPHFGKSVITYHSEFAYFTKRFRLKIPIYIEKKPGISPSPKRIREVIGLMKRNSIKLILTTPWDARGAINKIARAVSGSRVLVLPIQTNAAPGTGTYLKMLERCVDLIVKNLK